MNSMKIGTYQMDTSFGLYLPEYTIPAPTPQTHFVQIIGRDGSVDLSEAIGLHYDSRVWDLDFKCFNPTVNWHTLTSQVMNAIHGKRLNFEFDDDPDYFWPGRVSVSSYVSNHGTGNLKINITSDPFKYKKLSTIVTKNASAGTAYTGSLVTFNTANAKINDLSVSIGNVVYCFAFVDAFSIFKFLYFFFQIFNILHQNIFVQDNTLLLAGALGFEPKSPA